MRCVEYSLLLLVTFSIGSLVIDIVVLLVGGIWLHAELPLINSLVFATIYKHQSYKALQLVLLECYTSKGKSIRLKLLAYLVPAGQLKIILYR